MSDLQELAARNNAHWCDTVSRLHDLEVHLDDALWWTPTRSPDLYPDAVTLSPAVSPDEVLSRVDASAGCSVKDSFAALDLEPAGFHVLFEAQWIGRNPDDPAGPARLSWRPVLDPADLVAWSTAHGEADALLPTLLDQPDVRLFLAADGEAVGGGLALNRSSTAVGVSNLFVEGVDPALVWGDVTALAAQTFPGLPIVGYEAGDDLAHAEQAGFARLGPLRIWIR
jgi:hypothetical protein